MTRDNLTATATPEFSPLNAEIDALRFRFHGGPRNGQTVRITADRCTIGSSDDATFRIVRQGVEPVHCQVLRGEGGVVIRRLSENTFLNGELFETASLEPGDILTIGPIDFEVLSNSPQSEVVRQDGVSRIADQGEQYAEPVDEAARVAEIEAAATAMAASRVAFVETELESARSRELELTEQWETERTELREQLETAQAEIDNLTSQIEQANQREQQNSESLNSLQQRMEEFEEARQREQEEMESLRSELSAKEQEVQLASDEAERKVAELIAGHEQQVSELTAAVEEASQTGIESEQVSDVGAEYPQDYEPQANVQPQPYVTDEQYTADDQMMTSESPLASPSGYEDPSSDASVSEFIEDHQPAPAIDHNRAMDMLARIRSEANGDDQASGALDGANSPLMEAPHEYQEPVDAAANAQFDEQAGYEEATHEQIGYEQSAQESAEMQYAGEEPEQVAAEIPSPFAEPAMSEDELQFSEPVDQAPVDTASILAKFGQSVDFEEEPVAEEPAELQVPLPEPPQAEVPAPAPEDDSIQDYMAQLMRRVGGEEAMAPAAGTPSPTQNAPVKETPVQQPEPAKVENTMPLAPSEFIPRAVAPEASSNLQTLRAVANTSTRTAIDRHQRRSFDRQSAICWFIAIAAAVVCLVMAVFTQHVFSLPTLISLTCCVISVFASLKALSFSAKAKDGAADKQAPGA